MEVVRGTVIRVIYENTSHTYTVFLFKNDNEETFICTANAAAPKMGDDLELNGKFVDHKKYGLQFAADRLERLRPDSISSAKVYLLNLGIKGFGEKSVDKVIDYFQEDIVDLLSSSEPTGILEVPGLRKSIKEEIYHTLLGEGILAELNQFFEGYGISAKWSRDLYEVYGGSAIQVLRDNPYVLLRLDRSIPFSTADTLALNMGVSEDDIQRIQSCILWVLGTLEDQGHTCLPIDELIEQCVTLLRGYGDEVCDTIEELLEWRQVYGETYEERLYIYAPPLYGAERGAVERTLEILDGERGPLHVDPETIMERFEARQEMTLGEEQRSAIQMALGSSLSIITGGPGTGKTTIVKALVEAFQEGGLGRVLLCAPTGRAAKRLSESTGYEAYTIHRLLLPIPGSTEYEFEHNEDNPLGVDVVVVDEASMLNVQLYHALLRAIDEGTRLIIVGDVDQLPPIGPGFVLKDLIESGVVPVQALSQIYRQQEGNRIIENAYRINQGLMPILEDSPEFIFKPVSNLVDMQGEIIAAYEDALQHYEDPLEVQVITPMRRNVAGSVALAKYMQEQVNPSSPEVGEIKVDGTMYRVGDKVIQVENNYELEVYNGEIGTIFSITKSSMWVRFLEREVQLSVEDMTKIMPAYAITVHKSQGSEYGTVILTFIRAYSKMLQRNLLYTAITRAKHKVVIIGSIAAIAQAVETKLDEDRYSLLKERLQGVV